MHLFIGAGTLILNGIHCIQTGKLFTIFVFLEFKQNKYLKQIFQKAFLIWLLFWLVLMLVVKVFLSVSIQ